MQIQRFPLRRLDSPFPYLVETRSLFMHKAPCGRRPSLRKTTAPFGRSSGLSLEVISKFRFLISRASFVIPAQAGIHVSRHSKWTPVFTGVTAFPNCHFEIGCSTLTFRLRRANRICGPANNSGSCFRSGQIPQRVCIIGHGKAGVVRSLVSRYLCLPIASVSSPRTV